MPWIAGSYGSEPTRANGSFNFRGNSFCAPSDQSSGGYPLYFFNPDR